MTMSSLHAFLALSPALSSPDQHPSRQHTQHPPFSHDDYMQQLASQFESTYGSVPADSLSPPRPHLWLPPPRLESESHYDTANRPASLYRPLQSARPVPPAPAAPATRPRSQSQQSALAKAAMTNQLAASLDHVPRSIPPPSATTTAAAEGDHSTTTTSTTTTTAPAAPTNGAPVAPTPPCKCQQPPPPQTDDDAPAAGGPADSPPRPSHKTEPFPLMPPHDSLGPPAHPASLANALRSIDDAAKPAATESADSPYARSNSSTAPASPRILPVRQNSGSTTPRVRPHATTLSIPGMTRSNVSPDGKIADRDVASKLVVIMVGLPARGKSYITSKLTRYLSWQQHNTKVFNVGNRRRKTASMTSPTVAREVDPMDATKVATILLNGQEAAAPGSPQKGDAVPADDAKDASEADPGQDQSAKFFDPKNSEASKLREEIALETLNELLDYLIKGGGAVGILDATNSTIERRRMLFDTIKAREPKLGILFVESVCKDPDLLEANMRLKLSGPDYKDKDPVKSLEDFKERVKAYESAYVPLGDYEEEHGMQYIKMTDVGKKITQFGLEGFLSNGISHYLSSFNLSPRQIWLTRHGQSLDNQASRIGGNSELTERGHTYSENLYKFITHKRREWLVEQKNKIAQSSFPPLPGDRSPPYPEMNRELDEKNFCVWTSMLKRSMQTAEYFEADEDYDTKNWEMLNELNAGQFEGLSYDDIARDHSGEFQKRQADKLHYVYPGVGGEGYLQIISRLRDMVREIERIKDHLLIIGHRSICRVLLAYFMDLTRDDIAELDMPLGTIYSIEPKPYGIAFHAYKYDEANGWFNEIPDYRPRKTVDPTN